jgi:hypothetical protein
MKTIHLSGILLIALITSLHAQERGAKLPPPPAPQPPPPVVITPPASPAVAPAAPAGPAYVYEQKPMGGRSLLVTPEQAQAVIGKFKETFAKAGGTRILIYVNRELVDEHSGLKLSARREHIETSRAAAPGTDTAAKIADAQKSSVTNTYRVRDRREPALADRQTMRDVERLFGRPLRLGGASIVDQRTATQMLGGKPLDNLVSHADSEQARHEREAVSKVADVILEVLISSRNVTVPEISGDRVVSVPDIQATAIRLNDAKVLGQATAADLLNRAGAGARSYDVREVAEATALSLMEDMTLQ